jgi:two-component system KDP operon response regulator KdpE
MQTVKSLILIATNEPQTRKMLTISLGASGYRTETAESGKETIRLIACIRPELVVLDTNFSDIDTMEIIKQTREWSNVPIITISDSENDELMLEAFENGIDDFVAKPFNPGVLSARINATLRRVILQEASDTQLELGDISIDLMKHEVKVRGKAVQLSPKEYNLLAYLMQHRGKMLTHSQILNKVWGPSHAYDTQYLRVYIGQLRKKIDVDPTSQSCIITEAGVGYRMDNISNDANVSTSH